MREVLDELPPDEREIARELLLRVLDQVEAEASGEEDRAVDDLLSTVGDNCTARERKRLGTAFRSGRRAFFQCQRRALRAPRASRPRNRSPRPREARAPRRRRLATAHAGRAPPSDDPELDPEPRVVYAWPRNHSSEFRATLTTFKGRRLADIRVYVADEDDIDHPTRKGIAARRPAA